MSPELCRPTYNTRYTFYRSVDRTTMVGARLLRGSSSPPLLYRTGVFRVMAVCVKPQPSAEARLARELLLGRPSHVIEQTIVDFIQLFPHVRKGEAGFLLRHQSVEGVDAAVFGAVSRRSSSHVVICARMSRTDHFPVTPGSNSRESGRPAYDSLRSNHASLSRFNTCSLVMSQRGISSCVALGASRSVTTTLFMLRHHLRAQEANSNCKSHGHEHGRT